MPLYIGSMKYVIFFLTLQRLIAETVFFPCTSEKTLEYLNDFIIFLIVNFIIQEFHSPFEGRIVLA